MTRTITYAGTLQPGEASQDGDLFSIDRKPRDFRAEFLSTVPAGLPREELTKAAALMAEAWQPYPATQRSPRPGRLLNVGWSPAFMGAGIEDIPRTDQFAALTADFLPDADLEAWLLPVTNFSFEFLVTPADPA